MNVDPAYGHTVVAPIDPSKAIAAVPANPGGLAPSHVSIVHRVPNIAAHGPGAGQINHLLYAQQMQALGDAVAKRIELAHYQGQLAHLAQQKAMDIHQAQALSNNVAQHQSLLNDELMAHLHDLAASHGA